MKISLLKGRRESNISSKNFLSKKLIKSNNWPIRVDIFPRSKKILFSNSLISQFSCAQPNLIQPNQIQFNARRKSPFWIHSSHNFPALNPTQPNPTQPNPTQSNPTQSNSIQSNPTKSNPALEEDSFFEFTHLTIFPRSTQPNPTQPNPIQPKQRVTHVDRRFNELVIRYYSRFTSCRLKRAGGRSREGGERERERERERDGDGRCSLGRH